MSECHCWSLDGAVLTTALCCVHRARTSVPKSSHTDGEAAFIAAFSGLLACLLLFVCLYFCLLAFLIVCLFVLRQLSFLKNLFYWWSFVLISLLCLMKYTSWYFHRSPASGQSTGQTPAACSDQTHNTLLAPAGSAALELHSLENPSKLQ